MTGPSQTRRNYNWVPRLKTSSWGIAGDNVQLVHILLENAPDLDALVVG